MNKDAVLATFIGFGIGLLITGLLLLGPNLLKWLPKIQLPQTKTEVTATPTPSALGVTIDSPLPDAIEENSEVLVSGTTRPGATVVVAGAVDEIVVIATGEGKFAGKITLAEGKNDLTVTSYSETNHAAATVTVFYTPEDI